MIRVCIVCEGQTEVAFVRNCLVSHLLGFGVQAYPSILRAPSGKHRGGRVTVERLVNFMFHEYHCCQCITTLVDFYGFQDQDGRTNVELEQAILQGLQQRIPNLNPQRVRPYLQMHEFEALLFADVEAFQLLDGCDESTRQALQVIKDRYESPEDINDGKETAPSKRILRCVKQGSYSKTEHGPFILELIGLATIRQQCRGFGQWLSWLESKGQQQGTL